MQSQGHPSWEGPGGNERGTDDRDSHVLEGTDVEMSHVPDPLRAVTWHLVVLPVTLWGRNHHRVAGVGTRNRDVGGLGREADASSASCLPLRLLRGRESP